MATLEKEYPELTLLYNTHDGETHDHDALYAGLFREMRREGRGHESERLGANNYVWSPKLSRTGPGGGPHSSRHRRSTYETVTKEEMGCGKGGKRKSSLSSCM